MENTPLERNQSTELVSYYHRMAAKIEQAVPQLAQYYHRNAELLSGSSLSEGSPALLTSSSHSSAGTSPSRSSGDNFVHYYEALSPLRERKINETTQNTSSIVVREHTEHSAKQPQGNGHIEKKSGKKEAGKAAETQESKGSGRSGSSDENAKATTSSPAAPTKAPEGVASLGEFRADATQIIQELVFPNGERIPGTSGILRYLSLKHGVNFFGKTPIEQAETENVLQKLLECPASSFPSLLTSLLSSGTYLGGRKECSISDFFAWEFVLSHKIALSGPASEWFSRMNSLEGCKKAQDHLKSQQPKTDAPHLNMRGSDKSCADHSPEAKAYIQRVIRDFSLSQAEAESYWEKFSLTGSSNGTTLCSDVLACSLTPSQDSRTAVVPARASASSSSSSSSSTTTTTTTTTTTSLESRWSKIESQLSTLASRAEKVEAKADISSSLSSSSANMHGLDFSKYVNLGKFTLAPDHERGVQVMARQNGVLQRLSELIERVDAGSDILHGRPNRVELARRQEGLLFKIRDLAVRVGKLETRAAKPAVAKQSPSAEAIAADTTAATVKKEEKKQSKQAPKESVKDSKAAPKEGKPSSKEPKASGEKKAEQKVEKSEKANGPATLSSSSAPSSNDSVLLRFDRVCDDAKELDARLDKMMTDFKEGEILRDLEARLKKLALELPDLCKRAGLSVIQSSSSSVSASAQPAKAAKEQKPEVKKQSVKEAPSAQQKSEKAGQKGQKAEKSGKQAEKGEKTEKRETEAEKSERTSQISAITSLFSPSAYELYYLLLADTRALAHSRVVQKKEPTVEAEQPPSSLSSEPEPSSDIKQKSSPVDKAECNKEGVVISGHPRSLSHYTHYYAVLPPRKVPTSGREPQSKEEEQDHSPAPSAPSAHSAAESSSSAHKKKADAPSTSKSKAEGSKTETIPAAEKKPPIDDGLNDTTVSAVVRDVRAVLAASFRSYLERAISAKQLVSSSPEQEKFLERWLSLYNRGKQEQPSLGELRQEIWSLLADEHKTVASFGPVAFALRSLLFEVAPPASSDKETKKDVKKEEQTRQSEEELAKKKEEAAKKEEEARKEALVKKEQEEEAKRVEKKRRAEEEKARKEEEQRKRKEQEELERKKKEEAAKKKKEEAEKAAQERKEREEKERKEQKEKEEEERKEREADRKKKEEQERLHKAKEAEEKEAKRKAEEEAKKLVAEQKKKEDEARKKREEQERVEREAAEQKRREIEEKVKAEQEEKHRKEQEEKKRLKNERKKGQEEKKQQEAAERARKEEEARRQREEAEIKAYEERLKQEETKKRLEKEQRAMLKAEKQRLAFEEEERKKALLLKQEEDKRKAQEEKERRMKAQQSASSSTSTLTVIGVGVTVVASAAAYFFSR